MADTGIPFHRSLSGRMLLLGVPPTAALLLDIIPWLAGAMYSALRIGSEHGMQVLADRVAAEIERAASVDYARRVLEASAQSIIQKGAANQEELLAEIGSLVRARSADAG